MWSVIYEEESITSLLVLGYSCERCGTETTWGECFAAQKQTHSDSTIIKQDDLCVLFGSGTVETAEEQDHWKAAHSFNL